MEQLTISKYYKNDKNKEGVPFKDKNGKPYWKIAVIFDKYPDTWYSTLVFRSDDPLMNIGVGYEGTFKIWEENGYKNFKLPTKYDILESRVESLEFQVKRLSSAPDVAISDYPCPAGGGIDPADIPF